MFLFSTGRSVDRGALLVIALAAVACRKHEASRPVDAAPADAVPVDAPADAPDAAVKPAPVPTRLVASGDSTCAIMSDLTVRCWGGNDHGQLGNGLTAASPAVVRPEIRAVKDLQLADGTACALLDDASVACWGRIGWHGHAEDVLRPTGVLGVIGVTKIFVVPGRACARLADDSLVCWGNVDAGGHFVTGPTNRVPTPVVGLDHVAGLTPDGAFSDDGRLWHWGDGGVPRLLDVSDIREIGERDGTVCGRLESGRVVCAPSKRCGSRHTSPAPRREPSTATKLPKAAKSRKPTKSGKTARTAESAEPPSSGKGRGESPDVLGLTSARQLAFGIGFCVVTTTGKLVCGDGCKQIEPSRLERVNAVVGRCAQLASGAVTCFGGGKATAVLGITHATQLAVGRAHACAIVAGKILCWGNRDRGQLGEFAITP